MTEELTARPLRGRPPRSQETSEGRRRRGSNDVSAQYRLGVNFPLDPAYEYRWINEGIDGSRLHDKTVRDDWDVVSYDGAKSVAHEDLLTMRKDGDDASRVARRVVGESMGRPSYAYLCRKPKKYYDADKAKDLEINRQRIDAIRGGEAPTRGALGKNSPSAYMPEEGISIKDG